MAFKNCNNALGVKSLSTGSSYVNLGQKDPFGQKRPRGSWGQFGPGNSFDRRDDTRSFPETSSCQNQKRLYYFEVVSGSSSNSSGSGTKSNPLISFNSESKNCNWIFSDENFTKEKSVWSNYGANCSVKKSFDWGKTVDDVLKEESDRSKAMLGLGFDNGRRSSV